MPFCCDHSIKCKEVVDIGYLNNNFRPHIYVKIFNPEYDDDQRINADTAAFYLMDWVARCNINIILTQDIQLQKEPIRNDWGKIISDLIDYSLSQNLALESEYFD